MNEKRQIIRVKYETDAVMVLCDTQEKFFVKVANVSPLGMGVQMQASSPDITGKDVIIVADSLIMYAEVVRMEKQEDYFEVGINAKKFSPDVLEYLFEHIG